MLKNCKFSTGGGFLSKKSFTLSEVLITLVIIGIIASITVPVIFANYQNQAIKSSLKKNYSVLKQALDKYQVENGERITSSDLGQHTLKTILMKYLNVMFDCGYGSTDVENSCIKNYGADEKSSKTYKTYSGIQIDLSKFDDGQFVLNDGSLILLENGSSVRTYISVDVNGIGKKPNRLGKDLFMFQIMNNGELLPMGAKGTDYYSENNEYCASTSSNTMNGAGCTINVLTEI